MKMVKSLLLGAAAGLVALTGAQAADLPVKAKPVQYVKICSLYGAGFYYVPGTDTCLKIGGFFRAEWNFQSFGSFAAQYNNGAAASSAGGNDSLHTRTQRQLVDRSRSVVSLDMRSQTEYGTLRTYARGGWQWSTGDATVGATGATAYYDRGFIQLAGFTLGKSKSFYDFFVTPAYSNQTPFLFMDTGGTGTPLLAYTAQFGNGMSGSLSLEDHNEQHLPVVSIGGAGAAAPGTNSLLTGIGPGGTFGAGVTNPSSSGGNKAPDVTANLRVDQAWGSAQIAGALHNNTATYYFGQVPATGANGPADRLGFAIGGGVRLNLPSLGKGDDITVASNYCSGATRYCSDPSVTTGSGSGFGLRSGRTIAVGWFDDAYFNSTTAGSLELPTVWNVIAGIQHNWNPQWNTSLWGVYNNYKANSNAVDTLVCATVINDATGLAFGAGNNAGCANFSAWQVGSRTTWHVVTNLDISLEVMYTKVNSAMQGVRYASTTPGTSPTLVGGDSDFFAGIFRAQYNFWP
ncbi:MAG: porin [Rhizobiales bacterium]|nr:porin [Hyphomicrobiales bacterium]